MLQIKEYENYITDFIKEASFSPLKELILGETGYAYHGDIRLFYEVQSPKSKPIGHILLISRNANTLLFWPQELIQTFLNHNYQVIRFDHRGVGLSDWLENWSKKEAYSLEDMVGDAKAILDHLSIKKAHIVGASMGGMISQRFAFQYPEMTLSLCSVMSSGYFYDPKLTAVNNTMKRRFRATILGFLKAKKDFRKVVKIHLAIRQLWVGNGSYALNLKKAFNEIAYEIKFRKGYYKKSFEQHVTAIKKSGSMLEKLTQIKANTLIIHGVEDELIDISHAKKYTRCFKNVKSYYLSGMGHDLPEVYIPPISNQMLSLFNDSVNQ